LYKYFCSTIPSDCTLSATIRRAAATPTAATASAKRKPTKSRKQEMLQTLNQ